jgi:hypothetical protein
MAVRAVGLSHTWSKRVLLSYAETTNPPGVISFNKCYRTHFTQLLRPTLKGKDSLYSHNALTQMVKEIFARANAQAACHACCGSKVVYHIRCLCLYIPFTYAALTLGLFDQVTLATLKIYKASRSYR